MSFVLFESIDGGTCWVTQYLAPAGTAAAGAGAAAVARVPPHPLSLL